MYTIFIISETSKTSHLYGIILKLSDKLIACDKYEG